MISGSVRVRGLDKIRRVNALRRVKATDMKGLAKEFETRIKRRVWRMFQGRGVVTGPYGEGSRKWARNRPSTIKGKGFDKPMFSSRGPYGSSLIKAATFGSSHGGRLGARGRRTVRARFTLTSEKEYAKYLHEGRANMPGRWNLGFIEGDLKWLAQRGVRRSLHVGALR